jgi:Na+(H+)/acetate symporter ActP
MKKFILGIFIGVVLILLFTYLGGGSALKTTQEKDIKKQ